jgi:hypothetical protein
VQIGPHKVNRERWDWDEVSRNPFFCPDAQTAELWADYLDGVRKAGSSVGAVIEVVAEGVPPGLGAPIYGKLDADLAGALMGINAVKGVEIGDGFAAAELSGEANADEMRTGNEGGPHSCPTTPAAFSAAFPPVSPSSPALRSSRPPRSCRRARPWTAMAGTPTSSPRAATTPASASARCRSARR